MQPHVHAPRCVPGSALKLRAASCKIYNLLRLPIPLPYFHTLVVLQNVCFAIMSWSLLSFVSFLTPIVLFFAVLVMVGLREVAVALSDPFGDDDVDFPVDTWIAQLRANALLVHRDNRVFKKPNRDNTQSGSKLIEAQQVELLRLRGVTAEEPASLLGGVGTDAPHGLWSTRTSSHDKQEEYEAEVDDDANAGCDDGGHDGDAGDDGE